MEILLHINKEDSSENFDVTVTLEASHIVSDLANTLASYCGADQRVDHFLYTTNGEPLYGPTKVSELNLISGDALTLSTRNSLPQDTTEQSKLRVAVVTGPDAGRSIPIKQSVVTVGRSADADLELQDPQSGSHHLTIDATDAQITISPAGVNNEVRVNGVAIESESPLEIGDVVHFGATALAIRQNASEPPRRANLFGYLPFHRAPNFPRPITERTFKAIGNIPKRPDPRRFQFLAALAPLGGGIAMAAIRKEPTFLIFTLLSPIVAVASFFDQRKTLKTQYFDRVVTFKEDLTKRIADVRAALKEERSRRLLAAPDIEDLTERAEKRTETLWVRDRNSTDFLKLRAGVGDITPAVTVTPENTGQRELLDEAEERLEFAKTLRDIPFTLSLSELSTVALTGSPKEVSQIATSFALQAGCLHSPEDLVIASAVPVERKLSEWLKWLPHTRSSSSPLVDPHLVVANEEANDLLRRLLAEAENRSQFSDRNVNAFWPRILIFIDIAVQPDAAVLSKLLDLVPTVGMSVVWLSGEREWVPRQATAVLEASSILTGQLSTIAFTDPDVPTQKIRPERISQDVAFNVSRTLAPVQDTSSSNAATAIPRIVPLFNTLDIETCTPEWVGERWLTDRGYALQAPIGMTESGPFVLDLVEHGPHGLIGGTSGAGKSELVQSIVANLIAYNPPTKINFLFVDYKGGASSDLFKNVPHTVGYVTNLDAILSLRALTSLTAELNRRMTLLQGKAKDLAEMIEKYPEEAPPSLVIVVDEFATLVKALPDFVDGMVDIAQRGRSLGIHLILSTQRPSGAVNANILANTNLRISLRMLDSAESNSVIGTPEAAAIPGPLKGRAYARFGPSELTAFQSAWSGAPILTATGPPPVDIRPFSTLPEVHQTFKQKPTVEAATSEEGSSLTQVDVLLDAAEKAADRLGMERGRSPWLEVLPSVLSLDTLLANPRSKTNGPVGASIVVGLIDDPAAQDQYPATLDLESGGGLLVFGVGGSGKSTVLRTLALSAALEDSKAGGGNVTIFALDFASRELVALAKLPQCSAVATGEDLEGTTRIIDLLTVELERRRAELAAAASRGEAAPTESRVLLLLDGFENLTQTLEQRPVGGISLQPWLDRLTSIITDGRQVGIHVALAAGRRGAVRNNIMSTVSNRIILSQSEEGNYLDFGIPMQMVRGIELDPGRGFVDKLVVQIATWTGTQTAEGSNTLESVADLAPTLQGSVDSKLRTQRLPETVAPLNYSNPETTADAVSTLIGVEDMTGNLVRTPITNGCLAVVGPPESGRTSVLSLFAEQALSSGVQVWLFGSPSSPLQQINAPNKHFGPAAEILAGLEMMASISETFTERQMVCFDDFDLLDDTTLHGHLDRMLDLDVQVVGSALGLTEYTANPVYQAMKKSRRRLVLMPDHPRDIQDAMGIPAPIRPGTRMVPGRAVLVVNRSAKVVQVAQPNQA